MPGLNDDFVNFIQCQMPSIKRTFLFYMILPLFLIFANSYEFQLNDAERSYTPQQTPYRTSISGVPSIKTVILTCACAILTILMVVMILCIKQTTETENVVLTKTLLDKGEL